MQRRTRRDPRSAAEARAEARALLERYERSADRDDLAVLLDALGESDVPSHLTQRLALALRSGGDNVERTVARVAEELSFPTRAAHAAYEARELAYALAEHRRIERAWADAPPTEKRNAIDSAVQWLTDHPERLRERLSWLEDGHYGCGERLAARLIAELPARQNRAAMLFRHIVMLEQTMAPTAVNRVWTALPAASQRIITGIVQDALRQAGAVDVVAAASPARRARLQRSRRFP